MVGDNSCKSKHKTETKTRVQEQKLNEKSPQKQQQYESIHRYENEPPMRHSLSTVDRRNGVALTDPHHVLAGADRPVEVGAGRRNVRGERGGVGAVPEVAFVQRLATASAEVVGGEVEAFEFEPDDAVFEVLVALHNVSGKKFVRF